ALFGQPCVRIAGTARSLFQPTKKRSLFVLMWSLKIHAEKTPVSKSRSNFKAVFAKQVDGV
ncbi:MAG: hypothetical protein ACI92S_004851, partial [Planctomycetaceae bacterium]